MKYTATRTILSKALESSLIAIALALATGCGGMRHGQLRADSTQRTMDVPEHQRIPVVIGRITVTTELEPELQEAVSRYLLDVAAAELDRHGLFILVDSDQEPSLLADFGFADEDAEAKDSLKPQAALDIHVEKIDERLGTTVKVGFVSSQRKEAIADVRLTLRSLDGATDLTSTQQGRSSKGAWGVIATVNRDAMREGGDVWTLDGSMIGLACAEAVRAGVDHIARQSHFRAKALDTGIEKRLLRPRTERHSTIR